MRGCHCVGCVSDCWTLLKQKTVWISYSSFGLVQAIVRLPKHSEFGVTKQCVASCRVKEDFVD